VFERPALFRADDRRAAARGPLDARRLHLRGDPCGPAADRADGAAERVEDDALRGGNGRRRKVVVSDAQREIGEGADGVGHC
jgi:hypothetical protein